MKMNIKKIFCFITATTLLLSCSKSVMDKINENPNNPTEMNSKFILTDVMTSTAYKVTGSDYAFYAGIYMELNAGIFNQMLGAEMRIGEPTASSTYNNTWGSQYENLYELKIVMDKCGEKGTEAGNNTSLGIAQILTAYNLAVLTDLMGDVPYTEALQPGVIFQPKIDKQQDIYNTVFTLLDNAITNLGKTSTVNLGKQDLIYGGKATQWQKVAHGLKARYKMRLALKKADYQGVIDNANQSYTSALDEFKYNYDGSATLNPFYSFSVDRPGYFGASQSLHNKLVARNDPRDDVFFTSKVFVPNGQAVESQPSGKSAITAKNKPTYMQSYHELLFLKAEAYARLNDKANAETALQSAITVAFAKVGLTAANASTYYTTSVKPLFDANPVSEIMNQKYLAFYEDEGIEAYNDYRRLVAMGNNVITLENPLNAKTKFPWRFTYGSDDVSANNNVKSAYGDGAYVYKDQVWWAGGAR